MLESIIKKQIFFNMFTIFPLLLIISGCTEKKLPTNFIQDPKYYSKTLYVYSQATEIKYSNRHGTDWVEYYVHVDYPAFVFFSTLSTHLDTLGYSIVKENSMNSDHIPYDINGWYLVRDVTNKPYKQVKRWQALWKGKDDSFVRSTLNYENPENKPQNFKVLKVGLIYCPPDIAKSIGWR